MSSEEVIEVESSDNESEPEVTVTRTTSSGNNIMQRKRVAPQPLLDKSPFKKPKLLDSSKKDETVVNEIAAEKKTLREEQTQLNDKPEEISTKESTNVGKTLIDNIQAVIEIEESPLKEDYQQTPIKLKDDIIRQQRLNSVKKRLYLSDEPDETKGEPCSTMKVNSPPDVTDKNSSFVVETEEESNRRRERKIFIKKLEKKVKKLLTSIQILKHEIHFDDDEDSINILSESEEEEEDN